MATMTLAAETQQKVTTRRCRFCGAALERTFVDLGMSPLCETYPSPADLNRGEVYYPLHVYVCEHCFLVQLEQYESRRISSATMPISRPTPIRGSNTLRTTATK